MFHRYTKLVLPALLGAGLAVGTSARANQSTQTFTVAPTAISFFQDFAFNKFDTSTGNTLTGVTIFLTDSVTAQIDITNATGSSQNFRNASAAIPLEIDYGSNAPTAPPPTALLFSTPTASLGNGSVAANSTAHFPGLTASDSVTLNVLSTDFGKYSGPGNGTATLSFFGDFGQYSGSARTGVSFGGGATAGGTFTLTYTFTPPASPSTPEPGTYGLLVAGVSTSLVMVRRRRRK